MAETLDRRLAALGRHVRYTDKAYWVFAIVVAGIGVGLALVTGLWGLVGMAAGVFALCAAAARRRCERLSDG